MYTEWSTISQVGVVYRVVYSLIGWCCCVGAGLQYHRSVLYTGWSIISQVGAVYRVIYSITGRYCIQSGL
jgi:hypothetical protein